MTINIMPRKVENGLRLWHNRQWNKRQKALLVLSAGFLLWFIFCLPRPLFDDPHATVVYGANGELIGAKIAADGQWRFPERLLVSEKFKQAIIHYEDEFYYYHPGFNPMAIAQAFKQNLRSGDIKRGGSTITQQTIRLMRHNPKRTYVEKFYELLLALRLEMGYSKDKILSLYSSYAPFGGNVVGLEAASWRYFGRQQDDLSWAEATTLAVLPNAPGLIHPSRNRAELKRKRDDLLQKLFQNNIIDKFTLDAALQEPLLAKPKALPQIAPHFVEFVHQNHPEQNIQSTINETWQRAINQRVQAKYVTYKQNRVFNAAILVLDIDSMAVKAYVGNTDTNEKHQCHVDMVQAYRSTGSTLKPFLYAAALDDGLILPQRLLPDIPTYYSNYSPKNYNLTYQGAVPAAKALAHSLNIPAVRLLDDYGIPNFHSKLKKLHLDGVRFTANHYGLPLILGGAESSLWELTRAYAGMASTLNHFGQSGTYFHNEFTNIKSIAKEENKIKERKQYEVFSATAIWQTFNMLTDLERPNEEQGWHYFDSKQRVAWKTGTSYGNRDAWAIGVTPKYAVGVWVGNADGEGRTGTTGLQYAAPLMFAVFDILPTADHWFSRAQDESYRVISCKQSGYIAGQFCPERDTIWSTKKGSLGNSCPFHQMIHTDTSGTYRVNRTCYNEDIISKPYFNLPPRQEFYYAQNNPDYVKLPPILEACQINNEAIEFIYPQANAVLSIPKNITGENEKIVARATHKQTSATLYWYLDHHYLGETEDFHEWALQPTRGKHLLSVVDNNGNQIFRYFTVK